MLSRCDGDDQCLYDTKAFGNLDIGVHTRNNHRYYKFLDQQMKPSKYLQYILISYLSYNQFISCSKLMWNNEIEGRNKKNNDWKLLSRLSHDSQLSETIHFLWLS